MKVHSLTTTQLAFSSSQSSLKCMLDCLYQIPCPLVVHVFPAIKCSALILLSIRRMKKAWKKES